MPHIAIAILAAGSSKRMGTSKQLLRYRGQTFLERAIETAKSALEIGPETSTKTEKTTVFVIVASLEHISHNAEKEFPSKDTFRILHNPKSEEGISSSIRIATREALANDPPIDALMFMNCDQPLIKQESLQKIIRAYKLGFIVASQFGNTVGSPALFDRSFFPALLELKGDSGAKSLIKKHARNLVKIEAQEAAFDVDTPSQFDALFTRKLE